MPNPNRNRNRNPNPNHNPSYAGPSLWQAGTESMLLRNCSVGV